VSTWLKENDQTTLVTLGEITAQNLHLDAGQLDVWIVDLAAFDFGQTSSAVDAFSNEELARANTYHFSRDRDRFLCRRYLLREILSRYLGRAPNEVQFHTTSRGKPYLRRAEDATRIEFNLSTAHSCMALAVSGKWPVGIDIEYDDPAIDELLIMRYCFSDATVQRLIGLSRPARRAKFLKLWTRLEARVKLSGDGLLSTLDLPAEDLNFLADRALSPDDCGISESFYYHDVLNLDKGYFGTVCTQDRPMRVRCFHFDADFG
jgi:phosphopantetheinyl transferase